MKFIPRTLGGQLRLAVLLGVLLALAVRFLALPAWRCAGYKPQQGDIIFQSLPAVELVRLIEGVSQSELSHCGVVVNRNGKWLVCEALDTVHETPLHTWVMRGRAARFCVYRVKPQHRASIPPFVKALDKYVGRPYDYDYKLDDDYIYCAELVFKAYRDACGGELGKLMRLGDLNWKPYEDRLRKYNRQDLPLDRLMITPRHLSEAEQLERVYSAGL